jgi:uncharacterized membrane protein
MPGIDAGVRAVLAGPPVDLRRGGTATSIQRTALAHEPDAMRLHLNLSTIGLLLGTVLFALSLTPSLVPRPFMVQGLLSGLSLAAGYGIGVAGMWLWTYLQLPVMAGRAARSAKLVAIALCALIVVVFLWQASVWQNSLRALMGMEQTAAIQPPLLAVVAAAVFAVVMVLARLFRTLFRALSGWLQRILPRRLSYILGIAVSVLVFWSVIDGVLLKTLLRMADRSFQQLDAMIDDDLPRPDQAAQAGSAQSLIDWEDLGRQGRLFIASGPTAADLGEFFGVPTPAPIRVYVGLNSADTAQARAGLALAELKRVGGFDRSLLVLVTPTGTGWVDAGSQDTVEYLHRGDVATVAAQYSYLNSPLTLMTDEGYGAEAARTLFAAIYGHWRTLPEATRPRLFLQGLSLGSLNSALSFDAFDIIDDPFHGALWSGPPFRNHVWRSVTDQRDPGSPAWLPRFRDGAVVRFMNQDGGLESGSAPWGGFRIAFLQYASDPITFFSTGSAWREPDWMRAPRGPDVSADLRWYPLVTMFQLAADMMVGTAPVGYGHQFAPEHYLEAWLALTEPPGWSPAELERLRARFRLPAAP